MKKYYTKLLFIISATIIALSVSLSCHALSSSDEARYEALKDLANESKQIKIDNAKADLKKKASANQADYEEEQDKERLKNGGVSLANLIGGLVLVLVSAFIFGFIISCIQIRDNLGWFFGVNFGGILVFIAHLVRAINYGYLEHIAMTLASFILVVYILYTTYKTDSVALEYFFKNLISKQK